MPSPSVSQAGESRMSSIAKSLPHPPLPLFVKTIFIDELFSVLNLSMKECHSRGVFL